MPQLDTYTYFSQVFWLLITFIGFYMLVLNNILPNVYKILKLRQKELDINITTPPYLGAASFSSVSSSVSRYLSQASNSSDIWLNNSLKEANKTMFHILNKEFLEKMGRLQGQTKTIHNTIVLSENIGEDPLELLEKAHNWDLEVDSSEEAYHSDIDFSDSDFDFDFSDSDFDFDNTYKQLCDSYNNSYQEFSSKYSSDISSDELTQGDFVPNSSTSSDSKVLPKNKKELNKKANKKLGKNKKKK